MKAFKVTPVVLLENEGNPESQHGRITFVKGHALHDG